jgi:hypothetical protein
MRLIEHDQFGAITLAASTSTAPTVLASRCSPDRVDVSTRSNALYDRCATEMDVREAAQQPATYWSESHEAAEMVRLRSTPC